MGRNFRTKSIFIHLYGPSTMKLLLWISIIILDWTNYIVDALKNSIQDWNKCNKVKRIISDRELFRALIYRLGKELNNSDLEKGRKVKGFNRTNRGGMKGKLLFGGSLTVSADSGPWRTSSCWLMLSKCWFISLSPWVYDDLHDCCNDILGHCINSSS